MSKIGNVRIWSLTMQLVGSNLANLVLVMLPPVLRSNFLFTDSGIWNGSYYGEVTIIVMEFTASHTLPTKVHGYSFGPPLAQRGEEWVALYERLGLHEAPSLTLCGARGVAAQGCPGLLQLLWHPYIWACRSLGWARLLSLWCNRKSYF
jgi:hypothetical protein